MKYKVTLNGKNYEVEVDKGEAILVNISNAPAAPAVTYAPAAAAPVAAAPVAPVAPAPVAAAPAAAGPVSGEPLLAPMPGTIVGVKVSAGASVKKGDVLIILEAMKMENEICAPRDAVISNILAVKGAAINTDDVLLTLN